MKTVYINNNDKITSDNIPFACINAFNSKLDVKKPICRLNTFNFNLQLIQSNEFDSIAYLNPQTPAYQCLWMLPILRR